jgi:D-sedoheptulose 7-phosphate isomerase
MEGVEYIKGYVEESINVKKKILADDQLVEQIAEISSEIRNALIENRKVYFAGNGGSAADSQHLAAEFVSRFNFDRPGLAAIALTTDTSILTAIGNDYGYESVFSRQIQANGQRGDFFVAISTSGESKNLVKAVEEAKLKGVRTIAFCGNKGRLADMVDYPVCVPSSVTPHVQEAHIVIGHVICALIEKEIYG